VKGTTVYIIFEVERGPNSATILKICTDASEADLLKEKLEAHASATQTPHDREMLYKVGMLYDVGEFVVGEPTQTLKSLLRAMGEVSP